MTSYLDLPIGDDSPKIVTAVIEIPKDSSNKYEYDKRLHVFRLDRNLYSPVHYPADYGFLPQTLAEDGDPLDILVLGDVPTFPGCVYYARPIGMFRMVDQGINDEKILAVGTGNPRFADVESYSEIHANILKGIEHFFSIYKDFEGKRTQVLGWSGLFEAHAMVRDCNQRYVRKHAHGTD